MKYFVVSDIHGFYNELIDGLRKSGFNKRNKNHTLIVCGDVFDRGPDTVKVYKFLMSIPKSRCILIRGNHEQLYLSLLYKSFPERHDFHNKTVSTFCQIANMDERYLDFNYWRTNALHEGKDMYFYDDNAFSYWSSIKEKVMNSEITNWIKSDRWINYFELDKFVFVHSFVPTKLDDDSMDTVYNPNWRDKDADWDSAIWGCPFAQYQDGLFKEEKTLVVGHWHTSDFYAKLDNNHNYDNTCAPIYYSDGLVGIDGGCMYDSYWKEFIHPQNVLVIDENMSCYDSNGKKLA